MVNALEFIPKSKQALFSNAFEREDRLHTIQLLSDLKYLHHKDFVSQEVPATRFEKAIQLFRTEYKALINSNESWSNFSSIYNALESDTIASKNQLSEKEIDLLEILTSLEGAFEIKHISVGVRTLLSRVCLYRYKVFGFKKLPQVNAVVSQDVVITLTEIAKSIGYITGSWIQFSNVLGSQLQLTTFCKELYVREDTQFNAVVLFKINRKYVKQFRGNNFLISNKRRFTEKLSQDKYYNDIKTIVDDNSRRNTALNAKVVTTENIFLLRVIQVKLWIAGLYEGNLDNDFGPLTYEALREYLEYHIDNETRPKKELARVLFLLKSNHGLFNLVYFFNTYLDVEESVEIEKKHASVSNLYDFVVSNHRNDKRRGYQPKSTVKEKQNKLQHALTANINNYAQHGIALKARRQYKGKKRFLRFFAKVYDLIKNGVRFIKKIIAKLIRVIAKSIKIIFYEIVQGIKNFKKGLHFLFGKRITNTDNAIETDFDFDFDGVTTVNHTYSDYQLQEHSQLIDDKANAIYPALNFTRIVIEWGIKLANGTAWISILVGIAKLFKDFVIRTLKQRSNYLKPAVFF